MPEVSTVEKGGHIRHVIKAEPGEQFMLCRCYQSKEFPFCDGSHRQIDSTVGPAVIEVVQPQEKDEEEE